jgi:hypothetical protein
MELEKEYMGAVKSGQNSTRNMHTPSLPELVSPKKMKRSQIENIDP